MSHEVFISEANITLFYAVLVLHDRTPFDALPICDARLKGLLEQRNEANVRIITENINRILDGYCKKLDDYGLGAI
jgi:hypothetical protein